MLKPQKVKKWATPGPAHLSSRFCPRTSSPTPSARVSGSCTRLLSAWPERISFMSQKIRRPATAAVTTSMSNARVRRSATGLLNKG